MKKIDPKDLADIEQLLEEYLQYLPLVKSILEKALPELIDALSPLTKELIEGAAWTKWRKYEYLQELGFSESQAFDLLLDHDARMERLLREIGNKTSEIKLNTEKKGLLDILTSK